MRHDNEHIMNGDLLVVGKSKIDIELWSGRGKILEVIVEFRDPQISRTPCNPHHDELKWEIERRHGGTFLVIKWHVFEPRAVIWVVRFEG